MEKGEEVNAFSHRFPLPFTLYPSTHFPLLPILSILSIPVNFSVASVSGESGAVCGGRIAAQFGRRHDFHFRAPTEDEADEAAP